MITDSNLTKIIRLSLFGKGNINEINVCKSDFDEMRRQTVSSIAGDVIDDINTPQQLRAEWKQSIAVSIVRYTRVMRAQQKMTDILSANGIKPVILKGISAGMYYPAPEYREMGDVDFIVKNSDFEKAYSLLKNAGYDDNHGYNPRHITLEKNGVIFELHHHFSDSTNRNKEQVIDKILDAAIDSAERHNRNGFTWYTFESVENGLVLLQHIRGHLFTGLGLRQIIDWMMYVYSEMTEENWKIFEPLAEKCGNKELAIVVTRMCILYLGLPDIYPWCRNAKEDDCGKLLDYVLTKGNFGKNKNSASSRTISALNYGGRNLIARFKYEQLSGLSHWKAAGKYKILRPFAWIYGIGHHMAMLKQDGETVQSIINGIKESKQQRKLLEGLIHE